jgi:RimJ/RimL family protein N-acetyltransferase
MIKVYIRPLSAKDSSVSFRWRNNPLIWKFTGKKPDKIVTVQDEFEWINNVLSNDDEFRFAICIDSTNEYIGNAYLTNYDEIDKKAELHIFIGEIEYWNKGIGFQVVRLLEKVGVDKLSLRQIYLFVNRENHAAVSLYRKCGFESVSTRENFIKMTKNYE